MSIFYTDIAGFTKLSSSLTAAQVSSMLDRFFSKLDLIIEELELYKVGFYSVRRL